MFYFLFTFQLICKTFFLTEHKYKKRLAVLQAVRN